MFDLIFAAGLCYAIDGDTLRCGSERIRLWGVQAPERGQPGASSAKRVLQIWVVGKTVRCISKGRSYNRRVAQCYSGPDDFDLQCGLLEGKFAVEWLRYSHNYYAKCSQGRTIP